MAMRRFRIKAVANLSASRARPVEKPFPTEVVNEDTHEKQTDTAGIPPGCSLSGDDENRATGVAESCEKPGDESSVEMTSSSVTAMRRFRIKAVANFSASRGRSAKNSQSTDEVNDNKIDKQDTSVDTPLKSLLGGEDESKQVVEENKTVKQDTTANTSVSPLSPEDKNKQVVDENETEKQDDKTAPSVNPLLPEKDENKQVVDENKTVKQDTTADTSVSPLIQEEDKNKLVVDENETEKKDAKTDPSVNRLLPEKDEDKQVVYENKTVQQNTTAETSASPLLPGEDENKHVVDEKKTEKQDNSPYTQAISQLNGENENKQEDSKETSEKLLKYTPEETLVSNSVLIRRSRIKAVANLSASKPRLGKKPVHIEVMNENTLDKQGTTEEISTGCQLLGENENKQVCLKESCEETTDSCSVGTTVTNVLAMRRFRVKPVANLSAKREKSIENLQQNLAVDENKIEKGETITDISTTSSLLPGKCEIKTTDLEVSNKSVNDSILEVNSNVPPSSNVVSIDKSISVVDSTITDSVETSTCTNIDNSCSSSESSSSFASLKDQSSVISNIHELETSKKTDSSEEISGNVRGSVTSPLTTKSSTDHLQEDVSDARKSSVQNRLSRKRVKPSVCIVANKKRKEKSEDICNTVEAKTDEFSETKMQAEKTPVLQRNKVIDLEVGVPDVENKKQKLKFTNTKDLLRGRLQTCEFGMSACGITSCSKPTPVIPTPLIKEVVTSKISNKDSQSKDPSCKINDAVSIENFPSKTAPTNNLQDEFLPQNSPSKTDRVSNLQDKGSTENSPSKTVSTYNFQDGFSAQNSPVKTESPCNIQNKFSVENSPSKTVPKNDHGTVNAFRSRFIKPKPRILDTPSRRNRSVSIESANESDCERRSLSSISTISPPYKPHILGPKRRSNHAVSVGKTSKINADKVVSSADELNDDAEMSDATTEYLPNKNGKFSSDPDSDLSAAESSKDTSGQETSPPKKKSKKAEYVKRIVEIKREISAKLINGKINKSRLTMFDLIYYNPVTNPMKPVSECSIKNTQEEKINSSESEVRLAEESVDEPEPQTDKEDDHSSSMPVPQVKVGPNGEIILDEQSLVIETTDAQKNWNDLQNSQVVLDYGNGTTTFNAYSKKKRKRINYWNKEETLRFYRALHTVGTDFLVMQSLFPKLTRNELKKRFKKEEKENRDLVEKALRNPLTFDLTALQKEFEMEREEEENARQPQPKKRSYNCNRRNISLASALDATDKGVMRNKGPRAKQIKNCFRTIKKKRKMKSVGNKTPKKGKHKPSVSKLASDNSSTSSENENESPDVDNQKTSSTNQDMDARNTSTANADMDTQTTSTTNPCNEKTAPGSSEGNLEVDGGPTDSVTTEVKARRSGRKPRPRIFEDFTDNFDDIYEDNEVTEVRTKVTVKETCHRVTLEDVNDDGDDKIKTEDAASEVHDSMEEAIGVNDHVSESDDESDDESVHSEHNITIAEEGLTVRENGITLGNLYSNVQPGTLIVLATESPDNPGHKIYKVFMVSNNSVTLPVSVTNREASTTDNVSATRDTGNVETSTTAEKSSTGCSNFKVT